MTQPIQEPLTQRSITKAAWRESQLERRPRMSGFPPGQVPTARMMRTAAFSCSGDGVQRNPFLFADGNTEVERGVLDSLPYWDLVEDPSPLPSEWVVEIYLPGIYAGRLQIAWSGGTFYRTVRFQYGIKQSNPGWAEGRHPTMWANVAVGTLTWLGLFDQCIITQEDIDTAGSADRIYPQISQTSGAPVNVTGEFQFWGPVAFEGDHDPPFT